MPSTASIAAIMSYVQDNERQLQRELSVARATIDEQRTTSNTQIAKLQEHLASAQRELTATRATIDQERTAFKEQLDRERATFSERLDRDRTTYDNRLDQARSKFDERLNQERTAFNERLSQEYARSDAENSSLRHNLLNSQHQVLNGQGQVSQLIDFIKCAANRIGGARASIRDGKTKLSRGHIRLTWRIPGLYIGATYTENEGGSRIDLHVGETHRGVVEKCDDSQGCRQGEVVPLGFHESIQSVQACKLALIDHAKMFASRKRPMNSGTCVIVDTAVEAIAPEPVRSAVEAVMCTDFQRQESVTLDSLDLMKKDMDDVVRAFESLSPGADESMAPPSPDRANLLTSCMST